MQEVLQLMLRTYGSLQAIAQAERFAYADVEQALAEADADSAEAVCLRVLLQYAIPKVVDDAV
jgi:hypothetical protein